MRLYSKLNKKGLTEAQLIGLLIIIATTVVLLFFVLKTKNAVEGAASGQCAASVQQAAYLNRIYTSEFAKDIKGCEANNITIDYNKTQGAETQKQDAMKRAIADQMVICWKEWGSGKLDLFNGSGSYCNVCGHIAFVNFPHDYNITNFSGYIHNTTAYPGGKETYEDLLQGYASKDAGAQGDKLDAAPYKIQTNQNALILFWYSKDKTSGLSAVEKIARNFGWNLDIGPATKTAVVGAGVTVISIIVPFIGPVIGGTVVAASSALTYAVNREKGGYDILSATYLISSSKLTDYEQQCGEAAAISVSP